ncbi:hypothetical protein NX059_009610 [Plenodomus lindquistii]|nr:hypothetical protein NX059_009610 [Plenodomus lindquistii]
MHPRIQPQKSHNTRGSDPTVAEQDPKHEALHLAQIAMDSFSTPNNLSFMQRKACKDFKKIDLSGFYKVNAESVPIEHLRAVFSVFNDLFFFGAVTATVRWEDLNRHTSGTTTYGIYRPAHNEIKLDPLARRNGNTPGKDLMIQRLSTFLHEVVHAYLSQFACTGCPDYDRNQKQAGRHGWAFQRLAGRLEKSAHHLLDLPMPLKLSGFDGLRFHWKQVLCLPSLHEMEEWMWVDSAGRPTVP